MKALMLLCRSRAGCGRSGWSWPGAEIPKDLTSDVAFEAAYDFGFELALRGSSADVVQCRLVAAHTDDDYPIEGGIGLPSNGLLNRLEYGDKLMAVGAVKVAHPERKQIEFGQRPCLLKERLGRKHPAMGIN